MGKNLIALTVALLAALIGAAAKWYFDASIARQRNAFDLHKELHSEDMVDARKSAWQFIQGHPKVSFQDFSISRGHSQDAWHLWQVMQFFHRLAAAWKSEFIARRLAFPLFGELLVWWYVVVFRDHLQKANWQAYEVISDFYRSLERQARKNAHLAETWTQWHKAAETEAADVKAILSPGETAPAAVHLGPPIRYRRQSNVTQPIFR